MQTRVLFVTRAALLVAACASQAFADPVLITAPKVIGPTDTTITPTAGGSPVPLSQAEIVVQGTTLTIDGRHTIQSLVVERNGSNIGGVVTHTAGVQYDYSGGAGTDVVYGTYLTTTGSVIVQGAAGSLVASSIAVNARGFAAQQGPGAGQTASGNYAGGGGYGGAGGDAAAPGGNVYGSVLHPANLGSGGGGAGSPGGGSLRMAVAGTLTIDGTISASGGNAVNTFGAGGSGGSIWISCASLSGAGLIAANGGAANGTGGGGGGGRIACYYTTSNFAGTTVATGGAPSVTRRGGAGTIYFKPTASLGLLIIDNGGTSGEYTDLAGIHTFDASMIVRGGGIVGNRSTTSGLVINVLGNVDVENTGLISIANARMNVSGNMNVASGGGVTANAMGFIAREGPGAGQTASGNYAGGGAYGGAGGDAVAPGGEVYGSVFEPTDLGSGGGAAVGGSGGGAIRLNVNGLLTVDGTITANGSAATGTFGGGGSGGSIWIDCGTLGGGGSITAIGGLPNGTGGSGAGGRIACYYGTSSYTGARLASGGSVAANRRGGAGTVYFKPHASLGVLIIDNDGTPGEFTDFSGTHSFDASLIVRGGGVIGNKFAASSLVLEFAGDASIQAGSTLCVNGGYVDVAGNMTIDAGAQVTVNSLGYAAQQGPGAGQTASGNYAGGGAYGGAGGDAVALGGNVYGSVVEPVDAGSGGGATVGGFGGGVIRMSVGGTLTNNGSISANGGAASGTFGGGGAGGSVWIDSGTLTGNGSITASGGAPNGNAGGGSGGRIAMYYGTTSYTGTSLAAGAALSPARRGGAGTIYFKPTTGLGTLTIDNGGTQGESTDFSGVQTFDANLLVRNGGVVGNRSFASGLVLNILGSADVLSASVVCANGGHVNVSGNMTVDSTSQINVNFLGYPARQGPGAGQTASGNYAGGGGYGGAGGDGAAAGGMPYGSLLIPNDLGSGGGGSAGGVGGGATRLSVGGTFTLDGTISANGGAAAGTFGGGGSGGSVWLTCGTLIGDGSITASGGAPNGNAGGGGGGRIAIYSCDIQMLLTRFTAPGVGAGIRRGDDGTVYFGSSDINIFLQPDSTSYTGGDEISLIVDAASTSELTYQWYREGEPVIDNDRISGSTTNQLTFSPIDCSDGGVFYCLVRDACGAFPTDPATITVLAPSDYDGSGFVDTDDFTAFVLDFELGIDAADFDGTGFVDTDDFTAYVLAFEAGC
jgi:hypothetical protein